VTESLLTRIQKIRILLEAEALRMMHLTAYFSKIEELVKNIENLLRINISNLNDSYG
jgi:hypothetical protein